MTTTFPTVGSFGCASYGGCQANAWKVSSLTLEVKELRSKLDEANGLIADLEVRVNARTASAELAKAEDRIRLGQRNETTLQRSVDRLEEENSVLRRVMRTNSFDMEAVEAILGQIKPLRDV